MKTISPQAIIADQLAQLHLMEVQVARELPVLAGSVLNTGLRRLLSDRARCGRDRRDNVAELLGNRAHALAMKPLDSIRGILAEGNRDISSIRDPRARDVAMIEHCIRIEQHATTAYGIAIPLVSRIGFPGIGDRLKLALSDLDRARFSFRNLERELFVIAGVPSFPVSDRNPSRFTEGPNPYTCDEEEALDLAC